MNVDDENGAENTVELQAPSVANLRPRLFWTFGTQSLALLLRIVQQILLVPVLIRAWGPDLYGDWIVVFSAASSLTLLDFGMQLFFGNAMLIAWSKGDRRAYRRYFATAMGIYAIVLVSTIAILTVASLVLSWPAYLGTQVLSAEATLLTAGILALSTLSLIPFGIVTAIYRAHGDYSRGTLISILAEAARGFGIVFLALLGGTPMMAAVVYLAVALFFWAFVAFDQWRLYGEPPVGLTLPTMAEAGHALKQSSLYFIPSVTTTAVFNGPILLLATIGGVPSAVVAFTVSRTLTGFLRQVVEQFCHAIGAELTRQHAAGDFAKLGRLFMGAGRLISGVAGLLGGFTLVFAGPFIAIWTRRAVAYDSSLVLCFVLTVILTSPAQVARKFYEYNNRPLILVYAMGGFAAGTLLFCALLIKGFSATGAAAGTGIAELLSVGLLIPWAASKEMRLSLLGYFRHCYTVAALAFGLSYGVAWGSDHYLHAHDLLGLAALGTIWAILVAVPALFLLLGKDERSWLYQAVSRSLSRLSTLLKSIRYG